MKSRTHQATLVTILLACATASGCRNGDREVERGMDQGVEGLEREREPALTREPGELERERKLEAQPTPRAERPAAPPPTEGTAPAPLASDDPELLSNMRANCPMAGEDVKVEVSDTDAGVALTFTTATGDVDDLRRRARHLAQMYETHGGERGMMWRHMQPERGPGQGPHGPGMGMMHGDGPMPAVQATVEEVDRGARLVLQPKDKAQLEALRERVRMHQDRMQTGECWMLQPQA